MDGPRSLSDAALREVFIALGAETADLARLADRLQAVALPLIRQAGLDADSTAIEEAQRLDLLVQRLHALSKRIEGLAESVDDVWRVDVIAPPPPAREQDSGDVEFL